MKYTRETFTISMETYNEIGMMTYKCVGVSGSLIKGEALIIHSLTDTIQAHSYLMQDKKAPESDKSLKSRINTVRGEWEEWSISTRV